MSIKLETGNKQSEAFQLNVDEIRKDFPILGREVNGKPLVYLDNAATSQKPNAVIDAVRQYYTTHNANVHRGIHTLSQEASDKYEGVRDLVRAYINAESREEVIFVRGCTEGINLIARTFGSEQVGEGDEVIITGMEHHSNIVPWQMLCEERGAKLRIAPINDEGELDMDRLESLFNPNTRLLSLVHISNSLGTVVPVEEVIRLAHRYNVPVMVDGAQALPHARVDVQRLDCDFYVFSGHKMFGPTGIGVVYGKKELLENLPPYQGGGDMIKEVTFEKTVYNDLPFRFEAGTPNIAGTIGLGAAIEYLEKVGIENIARYETGLLQYATGKLKEFKGLRIIGSARNKASVISFHFDDIHPQDVGIILDKEGIAIRTGHHCTQPVMRRFGIPATSRASFAFYNTKEDVDRFIDGLRTVIDIFGYE